MNRSIYIILFFSILFASCDKDASQDIEQLKEDGSYVSIPHFKVDEGSRTALVYDHVSGSMLFSWKENEDNIGILTTRDYRSNTTDGTAIESLATPWSYWLTEYIETDSKVWNEIEPTVQGWVLTNDYGYTSYYPYDNKKVGSPFNAYPITYEGQMQTVNVDMRTYYKANGDYAPYVAQEKAASSHLAPFDYMLSTEKRPWGIDKVRFPFEHLGSIVRFFLRIPRNVNGEYHFNRITVVAPKPVFYMNATVNMTNCKGEEPIVAENHLTKLDISKKMQLGLDGFVMDYEKEEYSRYFIAYMMLCPVNLQTALTASDKLFLYLEGKKVERDSEGNVTSEQPVYFRTSDLTNGLEHINFKAGYVYQWTDGAMAPEDPILLEPIEVEEWNALDIDNTVNGNGTSLW